MGEVIIDYSVTGEDHGHGPALTLSARRSEIENGLVVLFGGFVFGAGFPAAVDPEVLGGVLADYVFEGFGVALGDVAQRVGLVGPVGGVDDIGDADVEVKGLAAAAGVADDDGHLVLHGEEGDGFVGAGFAAEEIDEDAFGACVLVGDEADGALGLDDGDDLVGGSLFGDDLLALALADAEDPAVYVGIIEGAGDAGGLKAEGGEDVAEDLPVAVMAGEHDEAGFAADEQFEHFGEVFELYVAVEGVDADEVRREEHLDGEHHRLPQALTGEGAALAVSEMREGALDVGDAAVAVLFVDVVEERAQGAGDPQVELDGEAMKDHVDAPADEVHGVVKG